MARWEDVAPSVACDFLLVGFYKYVAPLALGKERGLQPASTPA